MTNKAGRHTPRWGAAGELKYYGTLCGLTWSGSQPAVSVSFNAVRDADNPQLVKVQGVSGLGLRLEDEHGREVRLGSRGAPLLLTPGQSALTYRVATERTLAELIAGRYRAVVDFHLSYD